MSKKTALVIGAGIVGLATARALAQNGYEVQVFERNLQASGASVRNFGMIWPIGQPAGKQYELAIRTRDCWKDITRSGKLWHDPVGSLHLAYHPDEWQVLQELYELFKQEGRDVKLLNASQVAAVSTVANNKNCAGGLFSSEELIIDPRKAIAMLPGYLEETLGVQFHWGKAVHSVQTGSVTTHSDSVPADQIFICSGADFESLYPDHFASYPLTKCKLQMMRMVQEGSPRIGPAICGGLSLIHYSSFKQAPSLAKLKNRYDTDMSEYLKWGIHVMVSQNQEGELTVGDSHEYGFMPDPFDRQFINDMILQYLGTFTCLQKPRLIESWNGVYGKMTDGRTDLIFSPDPEVFVINAVGGAGMTLSFGLAEEFVARL